MRITPGITPVSSLHIQVPQVKKKDLKDQFNILLNMTENTLVSLC